MDKVLSYLNQYKMLSGVVIFSMFLYQLYFIFFGLDFQDSFYHVNRMISNDPFVMAFFSQKIGYVWSLIFGNHIVGFRFFNLLLYFTMLFLPMLLVKERQQRLVYIFIAFVVNFFLALLNWNILGYDTFSFFFIISVLVCFLRFVEKSNYRTLLLLSLLTSFCIAARLPNLLVIPIIIVGFFIFSKADNKINFLKNSLVFCAATVVFFGLLVLINYGSFNHYLDEIGKSLAIKDEDHGLLKMFENYIHHLKMFPSYCAVLIGCYFAYSYLINRKFGKLFIILLSIFPLFLYIKKVHASGFNTKVALFLTTVLISMIVIHFIKNSTKKNIVTPINVSFLIILFFLVVPCFGSNSGLKYMGIFLVFIPIVYIKSNFEYKKYFLIVLITLIPFAVVEKFQIRFMDEKYSLLTEKFESGNLLGIHTTKEKFSRIKEIVQLHEKFEKEGKQVYFYGVDSYLFNYLLDNSKRPFITYAMKLNNTDEINLINQIIAEKKKPVFFIVSNDVSNNVSDIEKTVVKKNYKRYYKDGYSVLEPIQ